MCVIAMRGEERREIDGEERNGLNQKDKNKDK